MKVNFSIEEIELNIDDDILEIAENILQHKQLKNLQEVEKGLWTAVVSDKEGQVEVEVQLANTRVRGYTCECAIFERYGVCQHIAATLHALRERRRRLAEDQENVRLAKLKKIETEKTPPRLTIPIILKQADKDVLVEFIADYARKNKQFSLALKTHFTSEFNQANSAENYKILIDTTLKNAKNHKGNITPKGWGEILTVIDQLKQKTETALTLSDLNQVFALVSLALPFVHRILRRNDAPKPKIVKRQEILVNLLRGAIERPMAKELNENIFLFILNEFQEQIKYDFIDFVVHLLFPILLKENKWHEKILQIIDRAMPILQKGSVITERDLQDIRLHRRLIQHRIRILQHIGDTEKSAQLIIKHCNNIDILTDAIQYALSQQNIILAKKILEKGMIIFEKSPALMYLEEFSLKIALIEKNRERIIFLSKILLIKKLHIEYYDFLLIENISMSEKEDLIIELEALPYKLEKRDILAAIFAKEKMYHRLLTYIQELQSFELLRHFGVWLWQAEPQKTIILHEEILQDYLYHHLGKIPAQRIKSLFEIYINMQGADLVKVMIYFLKNKFPQRLSLLEELKELDEDI